MKCYKCRKDVSDEAFICPQCQTQLLPTEELINQAISNEQTAIQKLYNMAYSSVYYTVHAMIKDPDLVLDIVQDSFIKGFKNLSQLKEPVKYRAWMKRIAHNHAIDYLRKVKPTVFSSMLSTDSEEMLDFKDERTENLPDAVADQKETARLMNEILQTLSEDQRLVVGMYYYEQMSIKEIAKELNCSENTIKSRLSYGRKKIELQVKELEKRGTKLYGLAPIPFLLWLFKTTDVQAAPNLSKELFQILNTPALSGATNIKIGSNIFKNIITKSISTKIIAGVAAVSIIGGGLISGYSIIKHQKESTTPSQNISPVAEEEKQLYNWEKYINEVLIPSYGRIEQGTYQFNHLEDSERCSAWANSTSGILNYAIQDFDNDDTEELLVVSHESSGQLHLRMYEHDTKNVIETAEYIIENDIISLDPSSDFQAELGIFFKMYNETTYICISRYYYDTWHKVSDYSAFVLTYENGFKEYIATNPVTTFIKDTICNANWEPYTETEISEMKIRVQDMAKKLETIGLANSANEMKNSLLQKLNFSDSPQNLFIHVEKLLGTRLKINGPNSLEWLSENTNQMLITRITYNEHETSMLPSLNTDFNFYVQETLIPLYGRVLSGTYEYAYQQQNDNTITIEKISDQYGILNYKILDFDNDGEDELLVISLEEYTDTSGWTEELCNRLVLQIYENKSGNVKKTGEYKMKANVLGGADKELSGVALKEWNGTLYICASVCNSLYTFSNGIKTEVCVLSYDGSMFHEYISMDKPDTGSEFEHAEPLANEMASKAEAIGLTQSATKMKETFIRCLDFSDIDDNNIMVFIQGENDGTYLQNFGWGTGGLTADKLGKVIVNLYFSPQ